MAQEIGVAGRARELVARRRRGGGGLAPCRVHARGLGGERAEAAEGVERRAMRGGVEQALRLELPVDLDQRRAQRAEKPHRTGLVVDECAAAPVRPDDTAQDELALGIEPLLGRDRAGGMVRRDVEDGRDAGALRARAHHRRVGARAEGEAERVEQDRLAGARLAGQRHDARLEGKVELVDQHDVTDREAGEHGRRARPLAEGASRF